MEYEVQVIRLDEQPAAVVRGRVAAGGIPEFLGGAFGEVLAVVGGAQGVAGPPMARYEMEGDDFAIEAGFPVRQPIEPTGRVEQVALPGGMAATTMHVGPYEGLAAAYRAVEEWIAGSTWEQAGPPWESYLDDPEVAAPRTVVTWPCRST